MAAVAAAAVTPDAGGSGSSSSSRDRACPLPNWIMLDRYVFTRLDLNSCKEDETTSPLCHTSQGDPFRVSFRFAAPPAISRFYLHVQGGNLSEPCHSSCRILASHKNAVLFCIYVALPVPVEYLSNPEGEPFPRFFKQDLFVYIAGDRPSLKVIPRCPNPEEGVEDPQLYDPLADIVQFWDAEAICILHDQEKNYVVGVPLCEQGARSLLARELRKLKHSCVFTTPMIPVGDSLHCQSFVSARIQMHCSAGPLRLHWLLEHTFVGSTTSVAFYSVICPKSASKLLTCLCLRIIILLQMFA